MVSREAMMKIEKDEAVQEKGLGSEAWWGDATDIAWHMLTSASLTKEVEWGCQWGKVSCCRNQNKKSRQLLGKCG